MRESLKFVLTRLDRREVPNWAVMLFWLLCYMHTVLGEKLEKMREEKWAHRHDEEAV